MTRYQGVKGFPAPWFINVGSLRVVAWRLRPQHQNPMMATPNPLTEHVRDNSSKTT